MATHTRIPQNIKTTKTQQELATADEPKNRGGLQQINQEITTH